MTVMTLGHAQGSRYYEQHRAVVDLKTLGRQLRALDAMNM